MAQKTHSFLNITIAFFLAFFVYIWQRIAFPAAHIHAFLPYLAISLCLKDHYKALCLAILAGLTMDLVSASKIGLWTLNFFVTSLLAYPLKYYFYIEKPLHLAIYTIILGVISSILYYIFLFIFDRSAPFFGKWMISDFFIMPVVDGIYALIWFSTIFWIFENLRKKFKWKRP